MDLMQKLRLNKYLKLDDLEAVKNREDRSTLIIHSLFPERFLSEEISHPDEVKQLAIDVSFDTYESGWNDKYNDTLCSGLTKFHNLDTLCVVDLDLSCDLWIEFARNCTCLKEIHFDSDRPGCKDYDTFCWYGKEAALDALFQIPTLKKVYMGYRIYMSYFPPGPSNINYLYLHVECDEEDKEISYEIYAKNLHTHKNIKTLILNKGNSNAYNILDLKLDQMHLEELKFTADDPTMILLPPSLKKIKFSWYDPTTIEKVINMIKLLPIIEEVEVLTNNTDALKQMKDQLKEEFKGLKKFVFLNFQDRRVIFDVLES
jgi:hypothetical protein